MSFMFHIGIIVSVLLLAMPISSFAATIAVSAGDSVQAAIDAAAPSDIITLAPGTYTENIDFDGKAVIVLGIGLETILQGTEDGPVVTFSSGEGAESVLDSVVVTGGLAAEGGGIYIADSDPTILRSVIFNNQSSGQGSGIYVARSTAQIQNNFVVYNHSAGGDPHAIEVVNASPEIVNNTIVRNDSNGIFLRGSSPALILNNLIALNGSQSRGRGICDFSGGTAQIMYNLFWSNQISALLTDGMDFLGITRAQPVIGPPRLLGNRDGDPEFESGSLPPILGSSQFEQATVDELIMGLHPQPYSCQKRAINTGSPDPAFNNQDGTRNNIGATGGPEAPIW